jgi:hypothetical protein
MSLGLPVKVTVATIVLPICVGRRVAIFSLNQAACWLVQKTAKRERHLHWSEGTGVANHQCQRESAIFTEAEAGWHLGGWFVAELFTGKQNWEINYAVWHGTPLPREMSAHNRW